MPKTSAIRLAITSAPMKYTYIYANSE